MTTSTHTHTQDPHRVKGVAEKGDRVTYEDQANLPRTFVVVSGPHEFGQYELANAETGETEHSDLRQYGWQFERPTGEQVRAEAVLRVDKRHQGCVPPPADELADEYDRETVYVASLARAYRWKEIATVEPQVGAVADLDLELARLQAEDRGARPFGRVPVPHIPVPVPMIPRADELAEEDDRAAFGIATQEEATAREIESWCAETPADLDAATGEGRR